MNYRKKVSIYIAATFLIMILFGALSYQNYFGICSTSDCGTGFRDSVGLPMLYVLSSVQIIFFVLLLLRREIFEFCFKILSALTAVYIAFVFSLPVSSCSFGLCFDRWFGSKIASIFFIATSLLIIILKYIMIWYKNRKGNQVAK